MPSGACGYHVFDMLLNEGNGNMRLAIMGVCTLLRLLSVILVCGNSIYYSVLYTGI